MAAQPEHLINAPSENYCKSSMLRSALLSIAVFVVPPQAETFYVDIGDSDLTEDVSLITPWATITHVLDNVTDIGAFELGQPVSIAPTILQLFLEE